jgi:hypothetical protein
MHCLHWMPYHAVPAHWLPLWPRASPRLDTTQLDMPHPTGSVPNPSPLASASHECLICYVSTPVAARRGTTVPVRFSPPRPHPPFPQFPSGCTHLLNDFPYLLSALLPLPVSLVSRRAPVLYFITTTAAVGNASHRLLSSMCRFHRSSLVWCSSWTCPPHLPITGLPPHPGLNDMLPQLLFHLELMW